MHPDIFLLFVPVQIRNANAKIISFVFRPSGSASTNGRVRRQLKVCLRFAFPNWWPDSNWWNEIAFAFAERHIHTPVYPRFPISPLLSPSYSPVLQAGLIEATFLLLLRVGQCIRTKLSVNHLRPPQIVAYLRWCEHFWGRCIGVRNRWIPWHSVWYFKCQEQDLTYLLITSNEQKENMK